VSVYLDGGHSAWQSVGTIAQTLVEAGVQNAQGFFLDVSNYQYTQNNVLYGTWVSDCIAYATVVDPGNYANCPNQYWNGGGASTEIGQLLGAYNGIALSPYGVWSDSTTAAQFNTSGIDAAYAGLLSSTVPTTHFVIDTSRNGNGPNDMYLYSQAPYNQPADPLANVNTNNGGVPPVYENVPGGIIATLASGNWCNPPGAGLGLRPTANVASVSPLLDAYLWVKTPGQSDGQCDSAGGVRAWDYAVYTQPSWPTTSSQQALFDPLWGLVDPAAGAWFPQQALQLAQNANPVLSGPLP
jgi:endoglucanase